MAAHPLLQKLAQYLVAALAVLSIAGVGYAQNGSDLGGPNGVDWVDVFYSKGNTGAAVPSGRLRLKWDGSRWVRLLNESAEVLTGYVELTGGSGTLTGTAWSYAPDDNGGEQSHGFIFTKPGGPPGPGKEPPGTVGPMAWNGVALGHWNHEPPDEWWANPGTYTIVKWDDPTTSSDGGPDDEPPPDSDGDGIPDDEDPDDDNDGIPDDEEDDGMPNPPGDDDTPEDPEEPEVPETGLECLDEAIASIGEELRTKGFSALVDAAKPGARQEYNDTLKFELPNGQLSIGVDMTPEEEIDGGTIETMRGWIRFFTKFAFAWWGIMRLIDHLTKG